MVEELCTTVGLWIWGFIGLTYVLEFSTKGLKTTYKTVHNFLRSLF